MAKPFFSIIMTAYNAEPFIQEALQSIFEQTFKDYEVVVVDNGSKDRTYEIAKDFLDQHKMRYQILQEPSNIGIGPARNVAIKAAQGECVAILDADDVWYPQKLEKVYEVFTKDPGVALVCHNENLVWVEEKKHKIIGQMNYGPYRENMYENLLWGGNCLSTSSTTIKRDKVIEAGMFYSKDDQFFGVEDYDLWLKLSKICKFYFINESLGEYRISKSNTYSVQLEKHIQNEKNVLNYHFSLLPPEQRPESRIKRRFAAIYTGAGWYLHRQGNFTDCRLLYRKAIAQDPLFFKTYAALLLSYLHLKW